MNRAASFSLPLAGHQQRRQRASLPAGGGEYARHHSNRKHRKEVRFNLSWIALRSFSTPPLPRDISLADRQRCGVLAPVEHDQIRRFTFGEAAAMTDEPAGIDGRELKSFGEGQLGHAD